MGAAGVPALAGWQAQGKKVLPPPLRQGDRGLPSCGPITPSRGRGSRARQPYKKKTWQTWVRARGRAQRAKEQKPWRTERRSSLSGTTASTRLPDTGVCRLRIAEPFDRSPAGPRCSGLTIDSRRSPSRRYDEARPQLSAAADAAGYGDLAREISHRPVSGGIEANRSPDGDDQQSSALATWLRQPYIFPNIWKDFHFAFHRTRLGHPRARAGWAIQTPSSRRLASSSGRTVRQSPARSSSRSVSMTSVAHPSRSCRYSRRRRERRCRTSSDDFNMRLDRGIA